MPLLKKEILSLLQSADKPLKRKNLLVHLRMIFPALSDREMRGEIETLITIDGALIESSHLGYSLIKTEEELNRAIKYLKAKAFPLFERVNCLKRNWTNNVLSELDEKIQLELFER